MTWVWRMCTPRPPLITKESVWRREPVSTLVHMVPHWDCNSAKILSHIKLSLSFSLSLSLSLSGIVRLFSDWPSKSDVCAYPIATAKITLNLLFFLNTFQIIFVCGLKCCFANPFRSDHSDSNRFFLPSVAFDAM